MDSLGNVIPAKACPACASAAGTGELCRRVGIQVSTWIPGRARPRSLARNDEAP